MKNYNEVLHTEVNEDGVTRHEQLGTVSDMLNDLDIKGQFYQCLKEEHKTDAQVYEEGIAMLAEDLERLYQELK